MQTLRDLVTAYRAEGTAQDKIAAMDALLPNRGEAILQGCEDHMAHAGDNYLPFLWRFYKSHRATLFRWLRDCIKTNCLIYILSCEVKRCETRGITEFRFEDPLPDYLSFCTVSQDYLGAGHHPRPDL